MSKSLNSVSLSGHLCADPRTHIFDDGTQVANLRLAVNNSRKEDGEWVDDPLFVDVKAYGRQAEAIERYLAKGSFVCVTGKLARPRSWTTDDGEKRFSMVVDRADVTFGPRSDGAQTAAAPHEAASAPSRQGTDYADDDIPF